MHATKIVDSEASPREKAPVARRASRAERAVRSFTIAFATLLFACGEPARPAIVAPSSVAAPPAATAASAETRSAVPIDVAYTHDVWIVVTPPLAIHLLARFDESADDGGADFDCEKALLRHARMLGANRLHVDHTATCRGAAYFVPPARGAAPVDPRDTSAPSVEPLRTPSSATGGDYSAALREWIRARWHRPSGMSEAESSRLCVVVQFSTSDQLRIWNVRAVPVLSSGNRAFDASVHDALESAIDEHASLPEPPTPDEARRVRRAQVRFAFSESNTAACR